MTVVSSAGSSTSQCFSVVLVYIGVSSQTPQPAGEAARYVELGSRAEAQGNLSEALSDFQAALQSEPGDAQVNFKIGLLKGLSGDSTGASAAFQRALQTQPDFPEAHFNLGLTIIARSKNAPDWPKALDEFKSALALRPNYPEALNMAGVCLLESGDHDAAITQFKSAHLLRPESAGKSF